MTDVLHAKSPIHNNGADFLLIITGLEQGSGLGLGLWFYQSKTYKNRGTKGK